MTCLRTPALSRRRKGAAALFCVALLLQCLAPPGYMAGSLADGWPVVLCPDGLPGGFLGSSGHEHHKTDSKAHDLTLDGYCPLGGVLEGSVVETAMDYRSRPLPSAVDGQRLYDIPTVRLHYSAHLSRAPPTLA